MADALVGGVIGGSLPVAEKGIGKLWQKGREFFDPAYAMKDKATRLGNIAKDNNSMRVAKRGIQASDDVANQIAEQAPTELGKSNSEMQNILNETTGRKIDIKQANINAKNRYADFINQNADKEVIDFIPSKAELTEEQNTLINQLKTEIIQIFHSACFLKT